MGGIIRTLMCDAWLGWVLDWVLGEGFEDLGWVWVGYGWVRYGWVGWAWNMSMACREMGHGQDGNEGMGTRSGRCWEGRNLGMHVMFWFHGRRLYTISLHFALRLLGHLCVTIYGSLALV